MELLMNYGLQVAATLLITLIGVLGTYLTLQLGKNANLKNINDAQKELIRAAKITVGELQPTMVSQLKSANSDGKLTPQEIASLRMKLLDKTVEGVRCAKDRIFSIQYHPESAPGPQDSSYLFDRFIDILEEGKSHA